MEDYDFERSKARSIAKFSLRQKAYEWQGVWYRTRDDGPANPRDVAVIKGESTYIDSQGRERSVSDNRLTRTVQASAEATQREIARRAGLPTYTCNCPIHGTVQRSTLRKWCQSCFNMAGQVRSRKRNPVGYYIDHDGNVREVPK